MLAMLFLLLFRLGLSYCCQMIVEPELRVADFAKAGADIISVHAEQSATIHLHRSINQVSSRRNSSSCSSSRRIAASSPMLLTPPPFCRVTVPAAVDIFSARLLLLGCHHVSTNHVSISPEFVHVLDRDMCQSCDFQSQRREMYPLEV
jgi:hypothetical protein